VAFNDNDRTRNALNPNEFGRMLHKIRQIILENSQEISLKIWEKVVKNAAKILFCKKYKLVAGHLGEGLLELLGDGLELLLLADQLVLESVNLLLELLYGLLGELCSGLGLL